MTSEGWLMAGLRGVFGWLVLGALVGALVLSSPAELAVGATQPVLRSSAAVSGPRTVVVKGTVTGRAAKRLGRSSRWWVVLEERVGRRWATRARSRLSGKRFTLRWTV